MIVKSFKKQNKLAKMPYRTEQEICNFFIGKAKDLEETNIYEAKAWLLTGKCMIPKNFLIQVQSYLVEKRQRDVEGCSRCFESLFRLFPMEFIDEINEMAHAVEAVTLATMKETEEQIFLHKVYEALPVEMRMEVFMNRIQHTPVLLEKCQSVLLLVKLFPDIINQHGANMLYTVSGCDNDVHSPVRSRLVTELVPAVLRLCKKNIQASPDLLVLLNQCIEYYVLVGDKEESKGVVGGDNDSRWEKLYDIVDQVGALLNWKIVPFFRDRDTRSGARTLEHLFQQLTIAAQRRNQYHYREVAYIAVILFLRCITAYHSKISSSSGKFGDKSKLTLVEIFLPPLTSSKRISTPDSNLPIITTVSPSPTVACESTLLAQYFITATKVWQLIKGSAGDPIEKEFFLVLTAMKSLNFNHWDAFQDFEFDYKTYTGSHAAGNMPRLQSAVKMASAFCGLENYKVAAEYAIKIVNEIGSISAIGSPTATSPTTESRVHPLSRTRSLSGSAAALVSANKPVKFSFYNCPSYTVESNGFIIPQRRVHFISENKSELLHYACNILIKCFHSNMEIAIGLKDDRCIGHLMTLLQLEWYSPPADMLLSYILHVIFTKGSFKYFPYFGDFVIEADILEHIMALANAPGKPVAMDIFGGAGTNASSSRRMGTRGVERGAKNDLNAFMKKQLLKNGRENLEALIIKFLTLNKVDILTCFEL